MVRLILHVALKNFAYLPSFIFSSYEIGRQL